MIEDLLGTKDGAPRSVVHIKWAANPFRGDEFERIWRPAARAVLNFGARGYAFCRSKEDPLQFDQFALFDSEIDFERYWYSDEIEQVRIAASGLFQVPVLPGKLEIVDFGSILAEAELER